MNTHHTILYVDDDHDDLEMIAEGFEKYSEDLRVVQAESGLEGLRMLEKMSHKKILPCLIILDINMPGLNGKETLKQIRSNALYKKVPIVLFSTSTSLTDKQFATQWDAEYVSKPLNFNHLEALIAGFVKKCQIEIEKRV
ncbi:MAG TPA: response regulator [Flavisolibacter sp.]|nr:response regulator [Flavisolibacter sp.]